MSYFDATRVRLYRETLDGRRVCVRRSVFPWQGRWYYISPEEERKFEQRTFRAEAASFVLMIVLVVALGDRLLTDVRWFVGLVIVTLLPVVLYPNTSGLEPADIDSSELLPRDANVLSREVARATGAPTLWFLLAASALMAAGQLYVLVTDGAWWAWLGLAMFIVSGASVARQLLLLRRPTSSAAASNTR